MKDSMKPANEEERLQAVRSLGLIDTDPEERFDRFTRLAKRAFNVPVAIVSLIEAERQWFKSVKGLEVTEIERNISFCNHTILNDEILIINDTMADEQFKDNPLVVNDPHIRFYAGAPIRNAGGYAVGTFCILDTKPKDFDSGDHELLQDLASMVEDEFIVQNLATVDDLTGLSNRRGFKAIASHAIAMCRRQSKAATLMFFDLDGFKQVNDIFGHAEGDKVLIDIGQILLQEFRNSDVIARLGGDEFCILLTGTTAAQVDQPLRHLDTGINSRNERSPYVVGYSVGTVAFDPNKHPGIEELLAEADKLMYEQKKMKSEG
jgi:diguanylate cyclase (GGDEF)-like protein